MSGGEELPDVAWLAALAGLDGMGPSRLAHLLAGRHPRAAWEALAAGRLRPEDVASPGRRAPAPAVLERWRAGAARVDVARSWERYAAAGIGVVTAADPGFPQVLRADPEAPHVLFQRGALDVLGAPAVAVVGTRRCTATGRAVADELGRDLSAAGVSVISGLALGIDGAAHAGALAANGAPPVGVVATGLDVVYPRRHAGLWRDVAAAGVVLSEYPLGTAAEPWRFPARNRLVAALADVVVVVESHARGGSLHTVESALDRDRTVMAVPGSVRSPASAGTNALLAAGAVPARDAEDVLVALGLSGGAGAAEASAREPTPPAGDAGVVLDALGAEPATMEHLANRLDVPLGPLAVHLTTLEQEGWVVRTGPWYERSRPRPGPVASSVVPRGSS